PPAPEGRPGTAPAAPPAKAPVKVGPIELPPLPALPPPGQDRPGTNEQLLDFLLGDA
ncbi:MAG: hypothetical protein JWO90_931, partial [Solirubrobacterales bacterium]|nr:hypothetical protein [Solirubrobacterales bacterium]